MYEAVLSARANTERLQYELRALYHGIRGFLHVIQEQNDVNLLLKNHFEEYKKMSDRIYHPIKTMDSIHRYMAPIQNLLTDVLADESLLKAMCGRAMTVKKYISEDEAQREIIEAIDYVLDAYYSMGGIINEIDRKHSSYTKSSIEKIRYLMTADQSLKGKLIDLLRSYAASAGGEREKAGAILERHIRVNRQAFLDGKSLYHKSARNRSCDEKPLEVERGDDFSEAALAGTMEKMKKVYSAARVRAYVDGLFANGAKEARGVDVQIGSDMDFILLMLAVLRAGDRGMHYTVEMEGGCVVRNGYRIPAMKVRKRSEKHRVDG